MIARAPALPRNRPVPESALVARLGGVSETLTGWQQLAGIEAGRMFRGVGKSNHPSARSLHPESVNTLVQKAVARAGLDPTRTARTACASGSSPTPA